MAESSLLFGILSPSPLPMSSTPTATINTVNTVKSTTVISTSNTLDAPDMSPMNPTTTGLRSMITMLTLALSTTPVAMDINVTTPSTQAATKATLSLGHYRHYSDRQTLHIAIGYTCGGFSILLLTALLFAVRRARRKDNSKKNRNEFDSSVINPAFSISSLLSNNGLGIPRPKLRTTKDV